MVRRALFVDRDGVLVRDVGLVTRAAELELLAGVPRALARARAAGYLVVVVTNQAVVARGLVTETELAALHAALDALVVAAGGYAPDAYYACPHHPHATLEAYRVACACRKPRPGLLLRAAAEHGLDLAASVTVGDRLTDIEAGHAAGTRTVQVLSGAHAAAPIVTLEAPPAGLAPDHTCRDLEEAVAWMLRES